MTNTKNYELKPCPHCKDGGHPEMSTARELEACGDCYGRNDPNPFAVVCAFTKGGCGATGGFSETEEGAAENWNMRNSLGYTSVSHAYIFPPTNRHECQYTHLQNCHWCSESDCCDNTSPDTAKSGPKKRWTVRDMAAYYLHTRGYGGLFNSDGECGCTLDDFMPCQAEGIEGCEAAFIFEYYRCAKHHECEKAIIDGEMNDWVASSSEDYCQPDYRANQLGDLEPLS